MPKIQITEKNYTLPGLGSYSNFAVFVPGFVASDKIRPSTPDVTKTYFEDIADDNGICTLSSQKDFENYVGKVAASSTIIRTFATPEVFPVEDEDEDTDQESGNDTPADILIEKGIKIKLTAKQFYVDYADQVYTAEQLGGAPEKTRGKDIIRVVVDESELDPDFKQYGYWSLTKADSWSDSAYYVIVLTGNEGTDEEANGAAHYGNQMAYELLGLGYPIIYKKLTNIADLKNYSFYEALEDRLTYDFRFIVNGLAADNATENNVISKLASTRGDCVAVVDIDEDKYSAPAVRTSMSKIIAAISAEANTLTDADKYTAIVAPTLCYNMAEDAIYKNSKFPAAFHYLACFANMLSANYAEWYAAAGLTRGISKYSVVSTEVKLGEIAEHALEPRYQVSFLADGQSANLTRAVNIIENIRGQYIFYGNRTAQLLSIKGVGDLTAEHFLNIRHLSTTLNKQLYQICRRFTFDPNSHTLWINFCNAIRPTLETMKADQGIEDYEIIQVATPLKATLKARIRIVPIEAVEDFDIEISLEDSLGGTAVTISE